MSRNPFLLSPSKYNSLFSLQVSTILEYVSCINKSSGLFLGCLEAVFCHKIETIQILYSASGMEFAHLSFLTAACYASQNLVKGIIGPTGIEVDTLQEVYHGTGKLAQNLHV